MILIPSSITFLTKLLFCLLNLINLITAYNIGRLKYKKKIILKTQRYTRNQPNLEAAHHLKTTKKSCYYKISIDYQYSSVFNHINILYYILWKYELYAHKSYSFMMILHKTILILYAVCDIIQLPRSCRLHALDENK